MLHSLSEQTRDAELCDMKLSLRSVDTATVYAVLACNRGTFLASAKGPRFQQRCRFRGGVSADAPGCRWMRAS